MKYRFTVDPIISRIVWRRRVLGINFTWRLSLRASTWRKLAWPVPLNMDEDDSE